MVRFSRTSAEGDAMRGASQLYLLIEKMEMEISNPETPVGEVSVGGYKCWLAALNMGEHFCSFGI